MEKVSCEPVEMCEKTSKTDRQSDPSASTNLDLNLCSHFAKIMIFKQYSYSTRWNLHIYQPGHALSASSLRLEADETSLELPKN